MKQVLIFSKNKPLINLWYSTLSSIYKVSVLDDIYTDLNADAIIIDAQQIDSDDNLLSIFQESTIQFLVVGSNWSANSQIEALTHGASGYCDASESPKLILEALKQILKGEIWIQRSLIPKVIGSLIKVKASKTEDINHSSSKKSKEILDSLSSREMDVVKMIQTGGNNKSIASTLHISERTVKAHLTSIFKKLNVPSRLHLAVLIKELS
ncbi:MAG: response regulator transcription factor [Methylococcales bacterium]|nr:response regulator transcription factor [Methylococcales bacterium]